MTDTDKDIVERLPKHIEKLANTTMDITLADWGPIVNDILKATTTIEALITENASLRARVEKLEGALTVIADTWITNDVGEDEYNEGYEDGLAIVGKIAITALEGAKHD